MVEAAIDCRSKGFVEKGPSWGAGRQSLDRPSGTTLVVLRSNDIWASSSTTNWYMRCDSPDAENPTWSAPVRFAVGSTLNKPTVLTNGIGFCPSPIGPKRKLTFTFQPIRAKAGCREAPWYFPIGNSMNT